MANYIDSEIRGYSGTIQILPYDGTDKTISDFAAVDSFCTVSATGISVTVEDSSSSFESTNGATTTWNNTTKVMVEFECGEQNPRLVAVLRGGDASNVIVGTNVTTSQVWFNGVKRRWVVHITSNRDDGSAFGYLLQNCEFESDSLPGFNRETAETAVKLVAYMHKGASPGEYYEDN